MKKVFVRLTLAGLAAALCEPGTWAQSVVRAERAAPAALSASAGARLATPPVLAPSPLPSLPAFVALPFSAAAAPAAAAGGDGEPAPRISGPALSASEADSFMETIANRERGFYQPGVGYDARTGLTFDSHPVDFASGELRGKPRALSAASKESLHLILLIKALQGRREAQLALSPDPNDPSKAEGAALKTLEAKIGSYETFGRDYPGYGGFLPWFAIRDGRMIPDAQWAGRVPALDNGELAWSLYFAANALKALGHDRLARRYQEQLDLMKKNVVPIFFDPVARKIRGVAVLKAGNLTAPAMNSYATEGYFVDDAYEGLLMVHFADLFGNWSGREEDREALWAMPLRRLVDYERKGLRITVERAWVGSSHEQWGSLVLPFTDEPLAKTLFLNAQRVRTLDAASRGWPGLRASTHRPVGDDSSPSYQSDLGIEGIGSDRTSRARIFAPYAAFPLAAAAKTLFATWLKRMLAAPGAWGPYGIGESFNFAGDKHAPVLTWDGKALPLIAWLDGISGDVRRLLIRDGLYDGFRARVAADYRRFDGLPIEGTDVPLRAPRAERKARAGKR